MRTTFPPIFHLASALMLLLSVQPSTAFPSPADTEIVPRALHGCSVFIQRWCADCESAFDVAYYNFALPTSNPWDWSAQPPGHNFWNQESTRSNVPGPGAELVPIQVGSNILHIIDVADPIVNNSVGGHSDPGKLSFVWGSESWNSWGAGSPCAVIAVGEGWRFGFPTNTSCSFQCDK